MNINYIPRGQQLPHEVHVDSCNSYIAQHSFSKRTSNRRQLLLPDSTSICSLCQCRHGYLSSPAESKNEQAQTYVLSLNVSSASLICCPCRHDITRALANPCFIPRWRKDTSKVSSNSSNCCVVDCSDTACICCKCCAYQ